VQRKNALKKVMAPAETARRTTMPRYRNDETDGPGGFRDSLKRFYDGDPPDADRKVGGPFDTTGRDGARRKSELRADETEDDAEDEQESGEDEGVITDEELAAAMKTASRSARRRSRSDETEDTPFDGSEDDDDDAPSSPGLRVTCPGCRNKFAVVPPKGTTLAEIEDEEESEGGMRTGSARCPECNSKFEVGPPAGYKFQAEDEDEDEDEDESEDAKDIADTAPLTERQRQRAAEALVSRFFARYRGKLLREQQSGRLARRRGRSAALDAFIESYRDQMKLRRGPAMPG
jgi:hypothetical protein